MIRAVARWGAGCALVASMVFLVSCAAGSKAAPATPAATARPTPTLVSEVQSADGSPRRWGYNPGQLTGIHDPQPHFEPLPPGYRIETYTSGLAQPTGIAFLPDGTMLVAQQTGEVRVVKDGVVREKPFFVADVYMPPPGQEVVELGLDGIAVDPNFAQTRYVYLYYTTATPYRRTVMARVRDVNGAGTGLRELLSLNAAPVCCHVAGSMRFADDGSLFVDVGDHQMETESQSVASPFGKILRLTPDGKAFPGNPFANVRGADPRIYAYGLRNPFDIDIDESTGRVFATENGYFGQDAIIEVHPGANYGWPGYSLSVPIEDVEQPLLFFQEPTGPAGIEFYDDDALPALNGTLLYCHFHRGGALHSVTFAADGSVAADRVIAPGCTSDVLTGPGGLVYFVDYVSGTVYRIVREAAD